MPKRILQGVVVSAKQDKPSLSALSVRYASCLQEDR